MLPPAQGQPSLGGRNLGNIIKPLEKVLLKNKGFESHLKNPN